MSQTTRERVDKYADVVQKGIEKLNVSKPGWAKLIDIQHLDMRDTTFCVLGQTYDSYYTGRDRVFGVGRSQLDSYLAGCTDADNVEATEHGFWLPSESQAPEELANAYDELTATWKKAVRKLQARNGGSRRRE